MDGLQLYSCAGHLLPDLPGLVLHPCVHVQRRVHHARVPPPQVRGPEDPRLSLRARAAALRLHQDLGQ